MRWVTRAILTVLLIASFAFGTINLWTILRSPAGGWLADRTEDAVSIRLESLLAREATPDRIGARLTVRLSEKPRDWAAIDALIALADGQSVVLSDEVLTSLNIAESEDRTYFKQLGKCLSCAFNPASCDLSGIVLCNVVVSVSPLGDIISIARESGRFVAGQDVDEIDLFLSTIGLGAVAIFPLTGGTSATLKAGAGLAKTAYRVGALSEPVLMTARNVARHGVDWSMIAQTRPNTFPADVSRAIRPAVVAPALAFLGDANGIRAATSTKDALYLISKADDAADARRIAVAARALGPRTTGAIEAVGKSRVFRAIARWSDEVYAVIASAVMLIVAVVGLTLSAAKSLLIRWLHRTARPGTPPVA